jgi:hypothetical protein
MPDIPPATMYRHLNKLTLAEIITVVEENQIRGTVEKVFSLAESVNQQTTEEIIKAPKEEQLKYFFTFLINLLGDFEKYLNKENFDLVNDGVTYSQAHIYADDKEFSELIRAIGTALQNVYLNKPASGRKARTVATIIIQGINN